MKKRCCIGVHVHAEPERLRATLAALKAHTTLPYDLVLLPDGPDEAVQNALKSLDLIAQSATAEPHGGAACFNRLAAHRDADVLVLLESGAIVGPGWLERLVAALEADPTHGLAGPSTNLSWNEQGVFLRARGSLAEVAQTAAEAVYRFEEPYQTLEPLYSLADFCYVVRREVVEAIGAADEAYNIGPCWEMDYNIRAARAGFQGVWVKQAYVYRSRPTTRQRWKSQTYAVANKHRYQDKFCALRLRNERTDYERHCLGDACEHFAPADLITLHLPQPVLEAGHATPEVRALPEPEVPPLQIPTEPKPAARPTPPERPATPPPSSKPPSVQPPLISCIMPTGGRWPFVQQSLVYFQRQTYPNVELIIVDDSPEDLGPLLPDDKRIRYIRVPAGLTIGMKRNRACEVARGAIIAHWDDDDWYAPSRLQKQVEPILTGKADITGLNDTVFFELEPWVFWRCEPYLHKRLFFGDVHGGTLVYRRRLWGATVQYRNRSLAEDAYFLRDVMRHGARLQPLPNDGLFVYLRHGRNAWSFACGHHVDRRGWLRIEEPALPETDRAFYAARSAGTTTKPSIEAPNIHTAETPLVSCIMPTANRRTFVPLAIRYWMQQDYANKELIILDDGADAVQDLIPEHPQVRYIRHETAQVVGIKRNEACEAARGEIIMHWDDDDWASPWRMSYQVGHLLEAQADVCGLSNPMMYNAHTQRGWQYVYPAGEVPWVYGATLCYTRAFWERNPFEPVATGEDNAFVWSPQPKNVLALPDPTFWIGLIHTANTSPKQVHHARWTEIPAAKIQAILGADEQHYLNVVQPMHA